MRDFQAPRRIRRDIRGNTGRLRGGKLYPVMAHMVKGSESGVLDQTFTLELDPIPGRLISEITVEMFDVFVPLQAIDAIRDPAAQLAGNTELVREKLLSGTPVSALENDNLIAQVCRVNPISIGGVKKVQDSVRLAYNCAVNMLRQRAYFRATLLAHTNTAIQPAIYAQTVLDRINGVLDPDDRINGLVNLELPNINLPVKGIGLRSPTAVQANQAALRSGVTPTPTAATTTTPYSRAAADVDFRTDAAGVPDVVAVFNGVEAQGLSLDDFYRAQTMDKFARFMDQMMRDNPQYGEEMVLRWAHGLTVDAGRNPFILAERRVPVTKSLQMATDTAGVEDDVLRTDGAVRMAVRVPIPRTELGGVIITLVALKPDETLSAQPHPFFTEAWTADNYVADELALDPVPVTVRKLDSNCAAGVETNVVAYTGLNALKEAYIDYGFARNLNLADVDNKTAIFQVNVPLSVNPDNVNYPDYLDHGVFAVGGTEASPVDVATFTIQSVQNSPTPMIVGPTPIEDVGVNNGLLFEE